MLAEFRRGVAATAIGALSIMIGVRTPGIVPPTASSLGSSSFMPR